MKKISLTTFIDFATKSGTPRVTCVRHAIRQYSQPYSPARDFYKPLRDTCVRVHKEGLEISTMENVLPRVSEKKRRNYKCCIDGLKKWRGRSSPKWISGSATAPWRAGELIVNINPELMLEINGTQYAIKLYFKAEKLSKRDADPMLHLIDASVEHEEHTITPAVLDVRRGKLHEPTVRKVGLNALAKAEAAAFTTLWDTLKAA